MKRTLLIIAALFAAFTASAQRSSGYNEKIDLQIGHADGMYSQGEEVVVKAVFDADFENEAILEIVENGTSALKKTVPAKNGVIFSKSYDKPTLVFVNVSPKSQPADMTSVGVIVDAYNFQPGFECPSDLNKFWEKQVKELRKVPMVAEAKPVELEPKYASKYECFDLRINSIDETPVIGYIAKPKNAAPKSLPIVIYTHGAGVNKPGSRSSIKTALSYAMKGGGAIGVDINALGMENNQPQDYYDSLANGPLRGYSSRLIVDHESFLFRTMFLRLVRALDYLTQDPAWDGERVLMFGSSQGGAQSAALAGIDPRVTAAVLIVPAMMDMGGDLAGHNKSWCNPKSEEPGLAYKIAPYYDTANLIRNFKGKLWVECGLIDKTCPASCVFSGYNMANCEKSIHPYPYRPHGEPTGRYREEWEKTIKAQRTKFIDDYLAPKSN